MCVWGERRGAECPRFRWEAKLLAAQKEKRSRIIRLSILSRLSSSN